MLSLSLVFQFPLGPSLCRGSLLRPGGCLSRLLHPGGHQSGVLTFYPTCQIFLPGPHILRMRISILRPFSQAEQQYLMYLDYCKGRFRFGVGVHIHKTQSNR